MKNRIFMLKLLCTVLFCSNALPQTPDEHLIAHWSFDETEGSIVHDSSLQEFNGANYGAIPTMGKMGNALDFNGINQAVHIPSLGTVPPDTIGNLQYGTIMVWFKFRDFTDEMIPILYFGKSEPDTLHNSLIIEIGHGKPGNRKLYFTIVNARFCYDSGINLEPNQWYHFAAVVSSSGNTGYLNGVELTDRHYNLGSDSTYTDFFASVTVKEMLAIGYGRYGKMDEFAWYNGLIDDVRIYGQALTGEDIQTIYQSGVTQVARIDNTSPLYSKLFQNYPNPFNPSTTIGYNLSKPGEITLKIYNITGQEISTLVDGYRNAGQYETKWITEGLPSGTYFYRLQAGEYSETKKLIMQR